MTRLNHLQAKTSLHFYLQLDKVQLSYQIIIISKVHKIVKPMYQ